MTDTIPHANDVLREMLEEHVDRFLDVVRGVIDERPEGLATHEGYTFAALLRPNEALVEMTQATVSRVLGGKQCASSKWLDRMEAVLDGLEHEASDDTAAAQARGVAR